MFRIVVSRRQRLELSAAENVFARADATALLESCSQLRETLGLSPRQDAS